MRKNEKITALYERLSRDDFGKDDDQQRESNSISNQKAMLEEFAARQGFTNIVHFTDATDIIGLKQNPTNGRRFSPIFLCIGHFSE